MKPSLLFFLFLFFSTYAWSQIFPNKPYALLEHYGGNLYFTHDDVKNHQIRYVSGTEYSIKKKKTVEDGDDFMATFDPSGNPLSITYTEQLKSKHLKRLFRSFFFKYEQQRLVEFETTRSVFKDTATYILSFQYQQPLVSGITFQYRSVRPNYLDKNRMDKADEKNGVFFLYSTPPIIDKVVRWKPSGYASKLRYDTLTCNMTFDSLANIPGEREDLIVENDSLGRISQIVYQRVTGSSKPVNGPCEFTYTPYLSYKRFYNLDGKLSEIKVYTSKGKLLHSVHFTYGPNGLVNEVQVIVNKKITAGVRYSYGYY